MIDNYQYFVKRMASSDREFNIAKYQLILYSFKNNCISRGGPNRRICQYLRKNLHNFTLFSKNSYGAHIAEIANIAEFAWMFEVFITNFFEYVMNDIIFFKLNFQNPLFFSFGLIAFDEVLNTTHFGGLLQWNQLLNSL